MPTDFIDIMLYILLASRILFVIAERGDCIYSLKIIKLEGSET